MKNKSDTQERRGRRERRETLEAASSWLALNLSDLSFPPSSQGTVLKGKHFQPLVPIPVSTSERFYPPQAWVTASGRPLPSLLPVLLIQAMCQPCLLPAPSTHKWAGWKLFMGDGYMCVGAGESRGQSQSSLSRILVREGGTQVHLLKPRGQESDWSGHLGSAAPSGNNGSEWFSRALKLCGRFGSPPR